MENYQLRALAIALWLGVVACLIPLLALHDEWTAYRDGPRVTATVASLEVRRRHTRIDATFTNPRSGQADHTGLWVVNGAPRNTPAPRPGDTLALIVPSRAAAPIFAADLDAQRLPLAAYVAAPLGALLCLVLGVLVWRIPGRAKARRARGVSAVDLLVESALRTRAVHVIAAGGFTLFAVAFAVVPWLDATASAAQRGGLGVLAATTLLLAALFARAAWRGRDPQDLVRLVTERPAELAWCYVYEVRAKFGVTAWRLRLAKADGAIEDLAIVRVDGEPLLAELRRRAPHARFGYSVDVERQYRAAPGQWRPAAAARA